MDLLHRLWKRLPRSLRRGALFGGTALIAPRPDEAASAPRNGPLVVAGYFGAQTGLGSAVRRLTTVLNLAGFTPIQADLTGPLRQGPRGPAPSVPPGPGTLIVYVNGPMLPWALLTLGRRAVSGKHIIAVWNWELPVLPSEWRRGFRHAHQLWVPSSFTAAAVAGLGKLPVEVVPNAVPAPDPAPLDRIAFGLPADAFVSLFVFDAGSSIERKNPLAVLRAHSQAFGTRPDRILVLKVHNSASGGRAWQKIVAQAAELPNVRIMDMTLGRRDLWALQRAADVFISLHRSEGFGLAIAEAMRVGRPVIATGWSGNMDFMQGEGTFAVPYTLVPARDPQDTYNLPETHWAEPRVEEAARSLAVLADNPAYRLTMGAAAAQAARSLAPEIIQENVRRLLLPPRKEGS